MLICSADDEGGTGEDNRADSLSLKSGGHQAFSTSKTVNNTMGLILHSFVLVPYHSWRISHAKHHAATGHMTRDEVFVPGSRSEKGIIKSGGTGRKVEVEKGLVLDELLEDAPLYRLYHLLIQQVSYSSCSGSVACERPGGA